MGKSLFFGFFAPAPNLVKQKTVCPRTGIERWSIAVSVYRHCGARCIIEKNKEHLVSDILAGCFCVQESEVSLNDKETEKIC